MTSPAEGAGWGSRGNGTSWIIQLVLINNQWSVLMWWGKRAKCCPLGLAETIWGRGSRLQLSRLSQTIWQTLAWTLALTGQHAPPVYITLTTASRWDTHQKLINSLLLDIACWIEKLIISPRIDEVFLEYFLRQNHPFSYYTRKVILFLPYTYMAYRFFFSSFLL